MNLWIRSQDKEELLKVEEICVRVDQDGFAGIWSYGFNKDLRYYLGTYETKERALEVLDEIQKYLIPRIELLDEKLNGKQICQIGSIESIIYQMPKE